MRVIRFACESKFAILHACMHARFLYCLIRSEWATVQWGLQVAASTHGLLQIASNLMIHHATEMRERILKRERGREKDDVPFGSAVATGERSIPPKG
jgi:hypothetical protein